MHLKPKKSLGQNFLVDQNIRKKIIQASALKPDDTVLEIGAGRGELTALIIPRVKEVYAVEIDRALCNVLEDKFKGQEKVKIINQDILGFNFRRYFGKAEDKVWVLGNIPYYITTPIIEYLFRYTDNIKGIFLTVQKELAQRMLALPGSKDYGSFSCFIQYYSQPEIIFPIKKTCFFPQPKVDSSFIRLTARPRLALGIRGQKLLFKIIRAAFNQRRKTLRNSLEGVVSEKKLEKFFSQYNIDRNIRPEKLSLDKFIDLAGFAADPP